MISYSPYISMAAFLVSSMWMCFNSFNYVFSTAEDCGVEWEHKEITVLAFPWRERWKPVRIPSFRTQNRTWDLTNTKK
jgi:hypothetical protein